jgi:soluble lytic murein transglycosylase-like protein
MAKSKKWDSKTKTSEFGLDQAFVDAIIRVESAGNPWAIRFEPKWKYFLTPEKWATKNGITVETERTLQAMSWGLMQIMGTKMRELGYDGPLTQSIDPEISCHYACKFLKQLFDKWGTPEMVAAAYNGGTPITDPQTKLFRNQGYVDKVMKAYKI